MSADLSASLHEILKEPLRRKILLKLGEHDGLSFEDLTKELKTEAAEDIRKQLEFLGDLVKESEDEYVLSEQGVAKRPCGQYSLTEKGIGVVWTI